MKLSSPTPKNAYKVLEADYTNLKNFCKYALISETILLMNFKISKDIFQYMYVQSIYIYNQVKLHFWSGWS